MTKKISFLFITLVLLSFMYSCSSSDDNGNNTIDDTDADGVADANDNCANIANSNQTDSDNDGLGDACDATFNFSSQSCTNGFADVYPCNDYDLLLHIPLAFFGADSANDSWGWTDPTTNKEYALLGLNNGTAFIDITNTDEAIYLGFLPTATNNSQWRDIKTYQNHAFIVSEAPGHGMQVFDLTKLRNVTNPPQTFTTDAHSSIFGNAHNIVINEDTGYAYPVGTDRNGTYKGGPLFMNIQDPKNPIFEEGYGDDGYSHDAQAVVYNGPDTDYTGKEIYIGSNENEVIIADITDKANPQNISKATYSSLAYVHQGWLTEDHRYLIVGDEGDEINFGLNSRSLIFDVSDLDNPVLLTEYLGPTPAIDHNGYIRDNLYYLANYEAGVRFIDISNISSGTVAEVGFFDTFPNTNRVSFNGVWSIYPYFESNKIVVSDVNGGLFIVKKSN